MGPNPTEWGKNRGKRHLLVDDRGVPLSIVVTGANVNDGKRLDEVLNAIMVKRKAPPKRRSKHLCVDAGYRSAEDMRIIDKHNYTPHVVGRRQEVDAKQRGPEKKARRWIVEVPQLAQPLSQAPGAL